MSDATKAKIKRRAARKRNGTEAKPELMPITYGEQRFRADEGCLIGGAVITQRQNGSKVQCFIDTQGKACPVSFAMLSTLYKLGYEAEEVNHPRALGRQGGGMLVTLMSATPEHQGDMAQLLNDYGVQTRLAVPGS